MALFTRIYRDAQSTKHKILVHTVKAKSVKSPIRTTACYDCITESHEAILCVSLGLHKPWRPWCRLYRWTVEHWYNFAWPSLFGWLFATASMGLGVPRSDTGLLWCIYILCDNFSLVGNGIWSGKPVWRSYGWCLWFRLVVLGDGWQHVCVECYTDYVWRVSTLLCITVQQKWVKAVLDLICQSNTIVLGTPDKYIILHPYHHGYFLPNRNTVTVSWLTYQHLY